jgi:regulator of replication initiation timing
MSYLEGENSEIAAKTINYLGGKVFRIDFLQRKRKISEEEKSSLKEDTGLLLDLNCNFKLKRNKIRNSKLKRRIKLKLVNFLPDKPKAPHNTSSFLIENFRKENAENENFIRSPDMLTTSNFTETYEDLYITPGSMKGILKSNLDFLLSEDSFLSFENSEKERDRVSIYSTECSEHDPQEKYLQENDPSENPFLCQLYENS